MVNTDMMPIGIMTIPPCLMVSIIVFLWGAFLAGAVSPAGAGVWALTMVIGQATHNAHATRVKRKAVARERNIGWFFMRRIGELMVVRVTWRFLLALSERRQLVSFGFLASAWLFRFGWFLCKGSRCDRIDSLQAA